MPARFTTAAGHDLHYAVLPEAVALAERLSAVDEVLVMRCDAHPLYRNHRTSRSQWVRCPAAASALVAGQTRPYTPGEAARFWSVQRRLHRAMPQYRDDLVAIAALACPLMPTQQLHPTAPAAALPVPAHRAARHGEKPSRFLGWSSRGVMDLGGDTAEGRISPKAQRPCASFVGRVRGLHHGVLVRRGSF